MTNQQAFFCKLAGCLIGIRGRVCSLPATRQNLPIYAAKGTSIAGVMRTTRLLRVYSCIPQFLKPIP